MRTGAQVDYTDDEDKPGDTCEYRAAKEALRKLRAENRMVRERPYRSATSAEAEQMAKYLVDVDAPRAALVRINALTGKHRAQSRNTKKVNSEE